MAFARADLPVPRDLGDLNKNCTHITISFLLSDYHIFNSSKDFIFLNKKKTACSTQYYIAVNRVVFHYVVRYENFVHALDRLLDKGRNPGCHVDVINMLDVSLNPIYHPYNIQWIHLYLLSVLECIHHGLLITYFIQRTQGIWTNSVEK